MRALEPEVFDTVWAAIEPLVPVPLDRHPLGCHRPRASDRDCFEVMLVHLVTGSSWVDCERLCDNKVSDTTVRARRDEWEAAGVFDAVADERSAPTTRSSASTSPRWRSTAVCTKVLLEAKGRARTRRTGRSSAGSGRSLPTPRASPIAWAVDGANRNDSVLLVPTLEGAAERGLLNDIETIWLDRGYDSDATRARLKDLGINDAVIAKRRQPGSPAPTKKAPMGLRWPVERTNSWLSNFGSLRRNTDRKTTHRLAQFALAVTFLLTAKLIDWRNRWSPGAVPIR